MVGRKKAFLFTDVVNRTRELVYRKEGEFKCVFEKTVGIQGR